jgi:polyisoprenoid-binding protein YceI
MNLSALFGRACAGVLVAAALAAAPVMAQPAMPQPAHDYKASPAGDYALDPSHTGLIVRVSHLGFSFEVFRFQTVAADLAWDPANPAADKLDVTVDAGSIATAPTGSVDFAKELSGPKFLNVAQFPKATFVSRAFKPIDATHGKVEGDLTILGKTVPATFDVELVGAGQGFHGPVLGVHARTTVDAVALGLPAFMGAAPIEIIVDTEFDKKS